ncbi:MAG TPA: STAS domain-containing protein [Anaerolineae bacterium]|jgi:anti-anti-sigma factor
MPIKSAEASVRHQPGVAIIDLAGEINAAAEQTLQTVYAAAESQNPGAILLNFSAVDYINSTGIALIVRLLAQARKSQRRLLAYGLNDHYREIFRITSLVDFISIFPDEATALAGV